MEVKRLTKSEERVVKRQRTEAKSVKLVAVESEKKEADGFLRKVKTKEGRVCKRGRSGRGVSGVEVLPGKGGVGRTPARVAEGRKGLGALNGGTVEWRREKEALEAVVKEKGGSSVTKGEREEWVKGQLGSRSERSKEKRLTMRVSVKGEYRRGV